MIQNITLVKKVEVATGTMAFYFAKPEGFEFRAGQFCDITLLDPPETDEEGNARGFSIVTAPYEADIAVATRRAIRHLNGCYAISRLVRK